MSRSDPAVAVLLPTLNGEAFIGEQIDALGAQEADVDWHLVVVDGGSTDRTLEIVRQRTRGLAIPTRILELVGAPGVNAGLNAGVRATDSPLLLIAEHDDVVGDGWLQAVTDALSEHWLVGSHMERFTLNEPVVTGSRRVFDEDVHPGVPVVVATGMGFRRSLWERLGGFDETYRYGGNDIEFCLRAHLAGHTVQIVTGATVHYRIRSGARLAFRQARAYGNSFVRLHVQFGADLLPRRPLRSVVRDYARLCVWTARALVDRSYRMRVAFRSGLLLGLVEGSLRHRKVFP